jgi:ribosomal protein L11 methyltransferase
LTNNHTCLRIEVAEDLKEAAFGILYQNHCLGLREEDAVGRSAIITAYWPARTDLQEVVRQLRAFPNCRATQEKVPAIDWEKSGRASFQPVRLTRRFWAVPSWSRFCPPPQGQVLTIDPKMSFGTGHHATTRICAQLLERCGLAGKRVLDVGTGTGILAILAAKFGAKSAVALDIDPGIAENLRENLCRNQVANVHAFIGTMDCLPLAARFDIVAANMIREELFSVLSAVACRLAPQGRLVLSGFLKDEADEARDKLKGQGLRILKERSEDEWWGALCARAQ